MSANLPPALFQGILQFVPWQDRQRSCRPVSKAFNKACCQADKEEDELDQTQWRTKYERRCRARSLVQDKEALDQEFCNVLRQGFLDSKPVGVELIREYLDKGATASFLPYLRITGSDGDLRTVEEDRIRNDSRMEPNVAYFCSPIQIDYRDALHDAVDLSLNSMPDDMLQIILEFVSSPCDSWRYHRLKTRMRTPNGSVQGVISQTIGQMVLHVALGSTKWYYGRELDKVGPSLTTQYKAYRLLRLLLLAASRKEGSAASLCQELGPMIFWWEKDNFCEKAGPYFVAFKVIPLLISYSENVRAVWDIFFSPEKRYESSIEYRNIRLFLSILIPSFAEILSNSDRDSGIWRFTRSTGLRVLRWLRSRRLSRSLLYHPLSRSHSARLVLIKLARHVSPHAMFRMKADQEILELMIDLESRAMYDVICRILNEPWRFHASDASEYIRYSKWLNDVRSTHQRKWKMLQQVKTRGGNQAQHAILRIKEKTMPLHK